MCPGVSCLVAAAAGGGVPLPAVWEGGMTEAVLTAFIVLCFAGLVLLGMAGCAGGWDA